MLRITREANGEVVLKVSGELNAENVGEVRALIDAERKETRIVLDLRDLTLAGAAAIQFLEKCETDGIRLRQCGAYVREWIKRERLEREE
jgi:anti-anti-sigma factor